MGGKLYFVELTDDERTELEALVSAGNHSAQKLTRARILLKSDQGSVDHIELEGSIESLDGVGVGR